jgi:dipeptidyl aminopeptidase/acylaminoacyl peptidase
MPWDGTELWVGELDPDGILVAAERVAGGPEESIFQPQWSPAGVLHFVSDRSGWWNLHRWRNGSVERLVAKDAEFGLPQWVFGLSTYGFETPNRIVCAYTEQGHGYLARLDTGTLALETLETPYTDISDVRVRPGYAVFCGASPTQSPALVRLDLATRQFEILRRSFDTTLDPAYLSSPRPIAFPTVDGTVAHALFYPPQNRDYQGPPGERPPLIVKSHGGPTSAATSALDLKTAFWTSRGFAVLDVNYRGSSGYGRAYRQSLYGQWGIADVDDCIHGARYLVESGEVDGNRLIIRGSSAGGYTTLCALTFHDVFKAGASYYGISDLETLVRDTHKFESRYLARLIGPYPQRVDLYHARSPLHFAQRLSCPVIFFQGLEDKVVPLDQAERMVEVLRAKGLPVAYLSFPGEQHGLRQAQNIQRALEAELYFYAQILGFELAEPVDPVPIG